MDVRECTHPVFAAAVCVCVCVCEHVQVYGPFHLYDIIILYVTVTVNVL